MWWASTINAAPLKWSLRPTTTTARKLLPVTVSASSQTPKPQNQEGGSKPNQLSGLDVLWAMKKATVEKKKNKRLRKGSASITRESDEEEEGGGDIDYCKVKDLCIKDEWSSRLDELDKLLLELSDTN